MDQDSAGRREKLLRMQAQARARTGALDDELHALFEASRSSNADDEHDPEGPTIAFERAQLTAVLAAARRHSADVDAALRRLDLGMYGVCEGCSLPIPAARLAARPTATTCIGCASRR
jgi:RNA polymerase-binding transcription factor DksA